MTHSDAAKIAAEKYPIYDKDIPEKGIKKTCAIDKRRLLAMREQLIKRLMNDPNPIHSATEKGNE